LLNKSFVEDVMYGRKKSFLLSAALYVISLAYWVGVGLRKILYRSGIFARKPLPCKVISVGNITLGGTGKTPLVVSLAGFLLEKGIRPAVVSRGYGRKDESQTLIVSDDKSILSDTATAGDEPVLIGTRLPGVPVVVGSNRYAAAQSVLQHFNTSVVILDDGFQHFRLKRDLDIALVDATDPFGNGKIFPAGILREPIKALCRAQAVIITRSDAVSSIEELKARIRRVTSARIFTSFQRPLDLVDYRTGELKPLSVLRGTKILAFSGIARPASFTSLLRALGAVVSAERIYPDHYEFKKADMAAVFKKAGDNRVNMIVTTEKDAVRLHTLKPDGIWALRIELVIAEREEWETFLLNNL
jgi:tetraacyldisaccharide 4'-kinase